MTEIVEGLDGAKRDRIAELRRAGRFFWIDVPLERDEPRRSGRGVGHSGARPSGAAGLRGWTRRPRASSTPTESTSSSPSAAISSRPSWRMRRPYRLRPVEVHMLVCGDYLLTLHEERGVVARAAGPLHAGGPQRAIRRLRGPRRDGRQRVRRAGRGRADAGRPGGDVDRPACRTGADGDAAGDQLAALENETPASGPSAACSSGSAWRSSGSRGSRRTTNATSTA